MESGHAEDPRPRVLALLKRHGWNATSFQILEPGFRYWLEGGDACVGHVDAASACGGGRWAGRAPAAAAPGRRVCWFATEQRFHDGASQSSMRIGDQPSWAPGDWTQV